MKNLTFHILLIFLLFLQSCSSGDETKSIGIIQWTEIISPYNQTYAGVIDGLGENGYQDGLNIEIMYANAEQDSDMAQKIARQFVKDDVDLIISLGTGSSLAALKATKNTDVPIVFSIVGAPGATGILSDGTSRNNITGVSMRIPVEEQFALVKELLPSRTRLGVFYSPDAPQAVAIGREAVDAATSFGWQVFERTIQRQNLNHLESEFASFIKQVDLVYIPTDPILGTPDTIGKIVNIADKHQTPVIVIAKKFVEYGAFASLHCDFYQLGKQTGDPVAQVLKGVEARSIPVQVPLVKRTTINLSKARYLGIDISRNSILKADYIID